MSLVDSCNYTTTELKNALASLSTFVTREDLVHDCNHIHGFQTDGMNNDNNDDDDVGTSSSFFKEGHELSMLQTITARRILDYENLLVRHFL